MRIFAQKANQPQQSTNLTRPKSRPPAASHEAPSLLRLQRTIGNQAVLRLLQARTHGLGAGPNEVGRIPVHGSTPITIQPKLAVNTPGDIYEEEADHISQQVMSMPESQVQRACSCGGQCSKCQTGNLGSGIQSLQPKPVGSGGAGQIAAPPIVQQVLASTGRPLDASPRAFMEHRFGHDFSRVRVHTDAKAAESTRMVNAVAYTRGHDIAFGAGQYAPETSAGLRLLAHELTHVMQQNSGSHIQPLHEGHSGVIQRDRGKPQPEKATSEEKLVDITQVPTRRALTDVIKDLSGSISEKDWEDKKKAASTAQASRDTAGATKIYLELYTEIKKLAQADKLAKVFGIEAVDINLATSEKDLKPGLNFSMSFKDANGRTSFLDDKGVNHQAKLPVTLSGLPSIAILMGPTAFSQNKAAALSTLRHEMMHAENNRSAINLLEKWQKQNKGKVSASEAESKFTSWLSSQKKSTPHWEIDLAIESAAGGKRNSELLGYVEGFMTTFHLERVLKDDEISRGEALSVGLLELKTAGDSWAYTGVQSEALGRIKHYYCDVLDQQRRDIFDKWVTKEFDQAISAEKASKSDEQKQAALARVSFYKNLKSIQTGLCSKKPSKKP